MAQLKMGNLYFKSLKYDLVYVFCGFVVTVILVAIALPEIPTKLPEGELNSQPQIEVLEPSYQHLIF